VTTKKTEKCSNQPVQNDEAFQKWREDFNRSSKRKHEFSSISFRPQHPIIPPAETTVYRNSTSTIGYPGQYPFTRGIHSSMYLGKLWTMRQFAGFGTPKETNDRFKYLLKHGQNGLSIAFDMPTLMGYDSDHVMSRGEVGREGVSVCTIEDMDLLFEGINLDAVTVSMTINCTAPMMIALYFAIAKKRGISFEKLRGTIQNDMLKEFIAQKEWIIPPAPSVKLASDIIEYCSEHAKHFNPISISGYHIREAGATAVQELAFTIADGLAYIEHCLKRGMNIDSFAGRLSFFFDVHNDFFEEVAKLRAARRLWAKLVKERYNPVEKSSLLLRMHAQTAGVSLSSQQPFNNTVRVTLQALAAVLGGVQSLHTNSMDETLGLPTEEAVKVALRTQQIIAEESGVANTIDPLGGSHFVEKLTDEIEAEALLYIQKIDEMGGMLAAVEHGYPQREIAESAYLFQQRLERGEEIIVGVNKYYEEEREGEAIPVLSIDPKVEAIQREKVAAFKSKRDGEIVRKKITQIKQRCVEGQNIVPDLINGISQGVTLGEISEIFREVFGIYRE
jgi:methylmalonyl-CoA mutase, N-terminal domain